MTKKSKSVIGIFSEAIGLYFSNFDKFLKYMSFPVWGQIIGLALIFSITFFYTQNLPKLLEKYPNLNDIKTLIILSIFITLPGLIIYIKAFWEFLVAYGAINSMLDNMLKSGRVYDFEAHTSLIKKRSVGFIGLWFLVGIFTLLAVFPLFWVIGGILGVYFVLIFQIFTYEQEKSPIECFKRSFELVISNFAKTFILMALVGILTYLFIPQIINKAFEIIGLTSILSSCIKPLFTSIPLIEIPNYGIIIDTKLATLTIEALVAQIIIQYTLPLRSILWGLWYKELSKNKEPAIKREKKTRKQRPSEKLMQESHKKYGKKKLDTNILKRASKKDD